MQVVIKILRILALVVLNIKLHAQVEPPTIMPGLASSYSTELNALGIQGRLYYGLNHSICFGPEFSYFQANNNGEDESLLELNANLHYIVEISEHVGFYPLTGINYTSIDTKDELSSQTTEDAFGLNAGFGFHYFYNKFIFFSEYKYVISQLDDHFMSIGFLYNFQLSKNKKPQH